MYLNAYQELVDTLAENKKTIMQIEWVETDNGSVDCTLFFLQLEGTVYLNPSPFGSINPSLIMGGDDFCLTRAPATHMILVDHWIFHDFVWCEYFSKLPKLETAFALFKIFPK